MERGRPVPAQRASKLADGGWPAGEVTEAIAADCLVIVLRWASGGGGPAAGRYTG